MRQKIPHIDIHDYTSGDSTKRAQFIETLGKGLLEFGFLTVGNHGLQAELMRDNYDVFRRFFNLPVEVKKAYDCVPGGARGYTPFGREHAKYTSIPDLKEFWHVGQELPEGHPYRSEYPANVWPSELPEMRELAISLYRGFERVARQLLSAIAEYFDLPVGTFADMMKDGNSIMRVLHYPPLGPDVPAGAVRAAAHEDINLITLLIESQGGGLEVLTHDQTWIPVNALAGDIIVDSGDMLSRVTNGVIPSTTHRVVNPDTKQNSSRYSMPFFVHPFSSCDLTVMDRFVSAERPPQWPPITSGAFLRQRLEEIGLLGK